MIIPVGVSKRHIHLTKEIYEELFGSKEMEVRNYLKQPTQFASTDTLDIKWNNQIINHVRIVGPLRDYNQVEINESDAKILGVNPPRRQSHDLNGSLPIILVGPNKEVYLNEGLILAEKHIHMDEETAKRLNLENKESVNVYINNDYAFDAKIKTSKEAFIELHIDTDEEQKYNLHQDDLVLFHKK